MKIENLKMKIFDKEFDFLSHIFLLFALGLGAVGIYRSRYDATGQFLVILVLSVFYILWGVLYHHLKGDLKRKLFFEYLILASIASVVGFLVFVR